MLASARCGVWDVTSLHMHVRMGRLYHLVEVVVVADPRPGLEFAWWGIGTLYSALSSSQDRERELHALLLLLHTCRWHWVRSLCC